MHTEMLEARVAKARVRVVHDLEIAKDEARHVARLGRVALGAGLALGLVGVRHAALGALAGIAGGLAMSPVHSAFAAVEKRLGISESSGGDPATVKTAERVVGPLEDEDKARAGSIVHHAMAAGTGAIYALVSRALPEARIGRGLAYGAAVWLVADEMMVPALGLSSPPWKSPLRTHLRALVAHLVYGAALDGALRVARSVAARV